MPRDASDLDLADDPRVLAGDRGWAMGLGRDRVATLATAERRERARPTPTAGMEVVH